MKRPLALCLALLTQACLAAPPLVAPPDPRVQRTRYELGGGAAYLPKDDIDGEDVTMRPHVLANMHLLRSRSTHLTLHTNNLFPGLSFQWQLLGQDDPHALALSVAPGIITGGHRVREHNECFAPPCSSRITLTPNAALSLPVAAALPLSDALDLLLMLRHDLTFFTNGEQRGSGSAAIGLIVSPQESAISVRVDAIYTHLLYSSSARDTAERVGFAYPVAQLLFTAAIH